MDGVKWRLAVPPEVTTEYVGTTIGGYYCDGDVMWRTQELAQERFWDLFGITTSGRHQVDVPAYAGVAALGADLYFPPDDAPQVRGPALLDGLDAGAATPWRLPARYLDTPVMRHSVAIQSSMQARVGDAYRVALGTGIEGPVTSAKLLRGQDFFLDLYVAPAAAHRLLDVVTDSSIAFAREVRRYNGVSAEQGGTGIADDFAGLISPAMWPEFVVPYYRRIYEAFGRGPRTMHSELLRPGHLPFLVELGVQSFDPGQDQYLGIEDIQTGLPGRHFWWNLKTIGDLCQGTPDEIRQAYEHAVATGVTQIMTELCRGTPRANVQAFVEIARHFAGAAA